MRLVTADTNVNISAFQFAGPPLQFLERARAGDFRLTLSAPIQVEVRRVLQMKFSWPDDDITDALSDLAECTTVFYPIQTVAIITADPTDDRILECALASGSAYVVSGDNHLLQLGSYRGIKIVKVADFLRLSPA